MYIPPSLTPSDAVRNEFIRTLAEDSSGKSPVQKWSSAIGIVTAIVGNVLISFALNTQRYAHMRIARERDEREENLRMHKRRSKGKQKGYGTQQSEIAEDRAKTNAEAEPRAYTYQSPEESNETDPLIPSVDSIDKRKRSASSSSGSSDDEELDEDGNIKSRSYLKSPIWWAGITMMTLGETGNFLAYGFAPASIVSPLGVVALISNCLIAPWLLRERFRWRDAIGVVIAVAGCVTIVMSASSSNPKLDPDSIWQLITTWEFETYLGITIILILALVVASNKFGEKSILIDLGLMGLFGGYTALSTKGVAALLSTSVWRVVTYPITYLLVAVLVGTAVLQIKYVNRALQRFDSTQVIPTQFCLFTLSVIIGSAILYRDFERTTTDQSIKFVAGCALTFFGVWCITSGRQGDSNEDEEMGVDEDAVDLVDEEGVQPEIREREDDPAKRRSLIGSSSQAESTNTSGPFDLEDAPPRNLPPANAAAIHSESTSSLPPENIQSLRRASKQKPPPMHATTSEPVVPKVNVSSPPTPKTPIRRNYSVFDSPSRNPPTTSAQQGLDHEAPKLLSRPSYAGLLPSSFNPFTSPLSSSLSAIVADSLRRGVDTLPSTSSAVARRKRKLGLVGGTEGASGLKRHSIASGEMNFDDEEDLDPQRQSTGSPVRPPGRMRSLSAAVGDIFGTQKRRRARSQGTGDERGNNDAAP